VTPPLIPERRKDDCGTIDLKRLFNWWFSDIPSNCRDMSLKEDKTLTPHFPQTLKIKCLKQYAFASHLMLYQSLDRKEKPLKTEVN
jgi:hypothetical protein